MKVWTDTKYKTKRKLSDNKKSLKKTGGGPYNIKTLTSIEEIASQAAGIDVIVEGINAQRFGAQPANSFKRPLSERNLNSPISNPSENEEYSFNELENIQEAFLQAVEDDTHEAPFYGLNLSSEIDDNEDNSHLIATTSKESEKVKTSTPLKKRLLNSPKKTKSNSPKKPQKVDKIELFKENMNVQIEYYKEMTSIKKTSLELKKEKLKIQKEMLNIEREKLELAKRNLKEKYEMERQSLSLRKMELEVMKNTNYLKTIELGINDSKL